jgi:hypothetical protein
MIIVHLSHGLALISSCADQREAILEKRTHKLKIQLFVLAKNLTKQLVLVAKSIFKFGDSQRKTLGGWVITYIGVGVRDVPRWLAHEAKASEVACLALGPLILLGAGGVIAGEVKVAEGCTRSGHHLLELLLLLIPEVVLLLVVALAVVVLLGVVILIGGGVEFLPLGAVGDEVGGVAALEAAPRRSPPLLAKHVQSSKLSHQQGNLVIGDALVLLICTQGRQGKLQSRWVSSVGGVKHMATNTSTSNKSLTSKRSIMVRTTLPRQLMGF